MLLLLLVVAGRLAKVLVGTPISGDFRGPPFRGKFGDGRAVDEKNIYTKAGSRLGDIIGTAMLAQAIPKESADRCVLRRWPRSGGTGLASMLMFVSMLMLLSTRDATTSGSFFREVTLPIADRRDAPFALRSSRFTIIA